MDSRSLIHRGVVEFFVLATGFALLVWGVDSSNAQVGMNPPGIGDTCPQLVFVDIFKAARPWCTRNADGSGPWDSSVSVPLESHGYPREVPFRGADHPAQIVHTLMAREIQGHYPAGTYTFSFEGEGEVELSYDSGSRRFTQAGKYKIQVNPSDAGIALTILRSERSNPLRNIKMIMPGFSVTADSDPFYPVFLARIKPFKVLRFMDFQHINNSLIQRWDQRKTPDMPIQSGEEGVAVEYLIDLCNRVDSDPWFCIPHLADDDYARQLARLVRIRLKRGRTVYLEYSNELWNSLFRQSKWVQERGLQEGLGGGDGYAAGLQFAARRSLELFRIMEDELGPGFPIIKILSSQAANSWTGRQMLQVVRNPLLNPRNVKVDALAVGTYVGNDIADELGAQGDVAAVSMNEIFKMLQERLEKQTALWIRENRKVADEYGVRLFAYEGGQHLAANKPAYRDNSTLTEKLVAANRDPRMGDLYCKLLEKWRQAGGRLFMAFSFVGLPGKYGSWGLLEWMDQPEEDAPKFHAVVECGMGDQKP